MEDEKRAIKSEIAEREREREREREMTCVVSFDVNGNLKKKLLGESGQSVGCL